MRSVSPKIYNKEFFLTCCLGSEEFQKSGGRELHPKVKKLLEELKTNKDMKVLDIGCGRGDITLCLAKRVKECVGIDYSKDAIEIANSLLKKSLHSLNKKVNFKVMNVKKMSFPDSYFDMIICIDVFEHLYKEELEIAMKEISRVLKKDGILFTRTVTNKFLYDFTYKYYILPVNKIITWVDQKIKKIKYDPMPEDPRIPEEKEQHVNEPTYYYLVDLFKRYKFKGKIKIEIGYLKEIKSYKTVIYNSLITLYPLSKLFPLNLLFGWAFVCTMKNMKS